MWILDVLFAGDLGNPISTCSLHVKRVDSALCIQLFKDRPKPNAPEGATEQYLFAQCMICLNLSGSDGPELKMNYFVEAVTDSSRYFVIRISDEKSGREAHIGMGFRERNDAMNFKMSLQEYENAMRKEAIATESLLSKRDSDIDHDNDTTYENETVGELGVSSLTLKEGEKIHVSIKGIEGRRKKKSIGGGHTGTSDSTGAKSLLLRKPPPPVSHNPPSEDNKIVNLATEPSNGEIADANSAASDGDEDEWGDFESVNK